MILFTWLLAIFAALKFLAIAAAIYFVIDAFVRH